MYNSLVTIVLQILLIWIISFHIYRITARRDGRAPIDDIGVVFLGIFTLYATLPSLFWLLQGGVYKPSNLSRLFLLKPRISEVVYLMNIALAYVIGFACVYLAFYRRVRRPVHTMYVFIGESKIAAAILIVSLAFFINLYLSGSSLMRSPTSRTDAYLVVAQLPLGFRQLLKLVSSFSSVASLVLLTGLIQRWPRFRWLIAVYVLALLFSLTGGGRADVVIGLFGLTICWHVFVRPITSNKLFAGVVLGLIAFTVLGIIRDFRSDGFTVASLGEFDHLWANAVELLQSKNKGGLKPPFSVRFNDLWAFVPSQLLWFEKNSFSIWFLDNFHPATKAVGGGFAFGAISEAVVGGGIFEALIRGALIGAIGIWIMKWIRKQRKAWWHFPLYLYMLIGVFRNVRDTTFRLWGDVVQVVLPALIVIAIISALLNTRKVSN